jgi:hypothetical protein
VPRDFASPCGESRLGILPGAPDGAMAPGAGIAEGQLPNIGTDLPHGPGSPSRSLSRQRRFDGGAGPAPAAERKVVETHAARVARTGSHRLPAPQRTMGLLPDDPAHRRQPASDADLGRAVGASRTEPAMVPVDDRRLRRHSVAQRPHDRKSSLLRTNKR